MSRRLVTGAALAAALLTASVLHAQQAPTVTASAAAQTSIVRTTRDRVAVWRRAPSLILAMLPKDVDLEALAKEGQWYQVRVPEKYAGAGGAVGYVFEGLVALVSGPPPPAHAVTDETPDSRYANPSVPAPPAPFLRVRGYGSLAYEWFLAHKSFDAILGQNGGVFYGGGGQVIFGHLFVDAGFEQFKKTGERVVVVNGQIFKLGIPDTITLQPFTITAGYRFPQTGKAVPYAGGGYTSRRFEETSDFAQGAENTDQRSSGFVLVGGVEYAVHQWIFVSGEARYTGVPNAIGTSGVAKEFNEKDLGGFSVVLKVQVGN